MGSNEEKWGAMRRKGAEERERGKGSRGYWLNPNLSLTIKIVISEVIRKER